MRYSVAPLALAAFAAAKPMPAAVSSAVAPSASAPAGCSSSYSGTFEIQVVNVTSSSSKRSINERQADDTALTISLADGTLTDSKGRTGYIAANRQFQFDAPPQAGAIYTAGFSVCGNGTLAIGDDAIWYQCLSGDFYNLYDQSQGAQCSQVYIDVIGGGSSSGGVSTQADGQPTETPVASQQSDGQVTATSVSSAGAVSQISDGQIQATSAAAVSQISDGQIQATTAASAAPVSQISDGQIQASTAATAAPVSQISDGQIQASTAAAVSPVSQIGDGQPQAPLSTGTGVAAAPTNGTIAAPSASVQPYTGAASSAVASSAFAIIAGVVAVALL